jgi:hypothetical protein
MLNISGTNRFITFNAAVPDSVKHAFGAFPWA